jgi:hypothetical protein
MGFLSANGNPGHFPVLDYSQPLKRKEQNSSSLAFNGRIGQIEKTKLKEQKKG